jgi:hypothetical protein
MRETTISVGLLRRPFELEGMKTDVQFGEAGKEEKGRRKGRRAQITAENSLSAENRLCLTI